MFVIPDMATYKGFRNLVLMMFSYGVAARIDEILSLKVFDIHLEAKEPFITLHGIRSRLQVLLPNH